MWVEFHLSSRQAFLSFTISQPGLEVGDDLCLLGVLVGEDGLRTQHGQDGADPLPHRMSAIAVDEAVGERAPSLVSECITPGYHEGLDELGDSLEGLRCPP